MSPQYCWSTDGTNGYAPPLILMLFIPIWGIIMDWHLIIIIPILVLLSGLFIFPVLYVSSRKYTIDAHGMTIYYPFGILRSYSWDEFGEIAVCKVHYAPRGNNHILAIRCHIGQEENGPKRAKNAREPWQSQDYELRNHKRVISVFYTPERHAEFQRLCPLPIQDYRRLREC